jgi:hypothetical protein
MGGFSGSVQIHFDAVCIGTPVHYNFDEFNAVVGIDGCRLLRSFHNSHMHLQYIFSFKALSKMDGQAFPSVVIEHVEHA